MTLALGIPEVLIGFALLVYIYMLVDRICKSCEQCSMNKSFGNLYSKINMDQIKSILEAKGK